MFIPVLVFQFCIASRFDCADYMREPSDIAVGGREFYVCDFKVPLHPKILPM